jgi:hypothetical protein
MRKMPPSGGIFVCGPTTVGDASRVRGVQKNFPQGLKPLRFRALFGTAKAIPLLQSLFLTWLDQVLPETSVDKAGHPQMWMPCFATTDAGLRGV